MWVEDPTTINIILLSCCALGLFWAIINALMIRSVKISSAAMSVSQSYNKFHDEEGASESKLSTLLEVGHLIERGAKAFLHAEYLYITIFVGVLAIFIFFVIEEKLGEFWSTLAFVLGAATSILCGYVGMAVAVFANYRCAYKAQYFFLVSFLFTLKFSLTAAFQIAYRAGIVMGFFLCSLALLTLQILISIYNNWFIKEYFHFQLMYEHIAAYGLGASCIALFGRVGGGIYTKAADVGADIVGKVEHDLPEDSPNNPATIADNVGDNVGDIAGMGADLFGSFAESTCAALVVASQSPSFYFQPSALYYPLLVSAFSIVVCFLTTLLALCSKTETSSAVQNVLKVQLLLSTVLMIPSIYIASYLCLPERLIHFSNITRAPHHAAFCSVVGLVGGYIIGVSTEYFTSHTYKPVQEVVHACETGAATNIIYGIALGNLSTIIPVIVIAIASFISHTLLGMFGISLAALGMLSILSIALTIDAYGPVSDNAGGIAEMSELGPETRTRTDILDAAGNTTAAIGKGFAIGSAGLVSLALIGAYLSRMKEGVGVLNKDETSIINPLIFAGLLVGAMMPYAFSAFTMKSVGKAALEMVREVKRQLAENPAIKTGNAPPDYDRCIEISTKASLKEMILPGAMVIFTPIVLGVFFGPILVAGTLVGALISGISMAVSSSNSGGAWDNAKKFIEAGGLVLKGVVRKKGSDEHKAAVIGDTVGDPLKDTSGPSLNILIKLMAILSLVFVGLFNKTRYLECIVTSSSRCAT